MSDILFGLQLNAVGVLAGVLVAALCAYLGVYVVLKRIVFVGASLAQISSAGIALAFLVGPALAGLAHDYLHMAGPMPWLGLGLEFLAQHPLFVSLIVTLGGVYLLASQGARRHVTQESLIGVAYVVASALTLMFIVRSAQGMEEVRELLDGNVVAVRTGDLVAMAAVFGVVAALHALFHKQVLFVSFDPEMAATQGFRVRRWELFFYLTLGVTISVAIQHAGTLSVFAYLVLPAVTALLVARSMRAAFAVAIGVALAATLVGFGWALAADLPTSPPTIAAMALGLLAVWAVRRALRLET